MRPNGPFERTLVCRPHERCMAVIVSFVNGDRLMQLHAVSRDQRTDQRLAMYSNGMTALECVMSCNVLKPCPSRMFGSAPRLNKRCTTYRCPFLAAH